jgi:hypothetical protein
MSKTDAHSLLFCHMYEQVPNKVLSQWQHNILV